MNIKQKFESIDQSQLSESQKEILSKIKLATKNFTIEDKKSIEKVDNALDNIISKLEKTKPQAIKKEVKEEKKEAPKKEEAPRKETSKKATKSKTKTPKNGGNGKRTMFSIAKEIRKTDESWEEAKKRAKKIMEQEKDETTKKMKTETEKLLAFIKRKKELDGLSGTSVKKDSKIQALPKGRRVSKKGWKNQYGESEGGKVYYENRDNRTDRLAPNFADKVYLEDGGYAGGGYVVVAKSEKGGGFVMSKPTTKAKAEKLKSLLPKIDGESNEVMTIGKASKLSGLVGKEYLKYADGGNVIDAFQMRTVRGVDSQPTEVLTNEQKVEFAKGGYVTITNPQEQLFDKGYRIYGGDSWETFEDVKRAYANVGLKGKMVVKVVNDNNTYFAIAEKERSFADGGTLIGVPQTPLARGLDIDYTGLVGETGGMSAGEMFAMGGSLGNHGLKQGDQIIKTLSGGVQKIKTKDGQTMYVDLASGYRGAEPPLPFSKGGSLINERRHVNKSQDYEVRYAKNKPNRTGYKGKRSFDNGGMIYKDLFEDYENQPAELSEIVSAYMEKFEEGDYDYEDSKKFLAEVESVGYTFDYGLDNEPYGLRPIGVELSQIEGYEDVDDDGYFKKGGSIAEKALYIPTYQVLKVHTTDGKVFENVYSDTNVITGVYVSEKPLRKKDIDDKNQLELFRKGGLPKTAIYIPRYKVDFIETEYDGDIQGNHIYGGVWIDMKKQFRLVEEAKKQGRFGNKPKFKVDDLVYNKRTKSVGIVRIEDEKGETKTDADGNVNTSELEKYNPLKNKNHKNAKVAPSTQKEIESRGLFKPFSKYEGGGKTTNNEPREGDLITNVGAYGSRITKVTDSYVEFYDNRAMKPVVCKKSDLVLNNLDDDGDDDGYYEDEPNSWICKKSYEGGGKTTFKEKATAIAKKFEGKKVEPKYQKEYGKTYDKAEAKEVGNKIAGSQKAKYDAKMSGGGYLKNGYFKNEIDNDYIEEINKYYNKWNSIKDEKDSENFKKTKPPMFGTYKTTDILEQIKHFEKLDIPFQANEVSRNQFKKEVSKIIDNFTNKKSYGKGGSTKRGGAMQLAKQIRKEGESWQSALKRANEQIRNKK